MGDVTFSREGVLTWVFASFQFFTKFDMRKEEWGDFGGRTNAASRPTTNPQAKSDLDFSGVYTNRPAMWEEGGRDRKTERQGGTKQHLPQSTDIQP